MRSGHADDPSLARIGAFSDGVFAIAFANPPLAVAGFVAAVLLYALPLPRLVALRQRGSRRRG